MSRVCFPPLRDHKKKNIDEEPKPFEFCADCENVIYEFEDRIYKNSQMIANINQYISIYQYIWSLD